MPHYAVSSNKPHRGFVVYRAGLPSVVRQPCLRNAPGSNAKGVTLSLLTRVSCAKCPMRIFKSEDNATLTALLSHHPPHDSVGVARQHCPVNNETAMRFLGRMPLVPQPLDFYLSWIEGLYAWLMERTHGPCVPTCLLSTNHLNKRTNHKGQNLKFKLQCQLIIKVKIQCSNFKVKVPTCA